ncbi:hypothetical protein ACFE04_003032 [Oxalis oulophora]
MALVSRISISSSSSSSFHSSNFKQQSNNKTPIIIHCSLPSSSSSSPFTEKHSIERYQRDNWAFKNLHQGPSFTSCSLPSDTDSIRENDIALQLPELKKLLQVLKHKRESSNIDNTNSSGPGNVYLVGTGPGDPELLTLKAVRVIQSAHLLLYDRLVSNQVLDLVAPNARLLYVGKTAGYHSRTQETVINVVLIISMLVRFSGITAASGIAAELGIPLTHRGVATSVRFLTGHSRKGGKDPLFVAENAADPDSTLVVYMGLATLPALAEKLMYHGLPSDTPAVAVERGTTPQQRMVFAELKDLANEITAAELVSPTLIVIGKVVALSPLWPHASIEESCLLEKSDICGHRKMTKQLDLLRILFEIHPDEVASFGQGICEVPSWFKIPKLWQLLHDPYEERRAAYIYVLFGMMYFLCPMIILETFYSIGGWNASSSSSSSSSSSWMKIIADRRRSFSSTNIQSQPPRLIDLFDPQPKKEKVPIHESDLVSDETLWALYQRWISSMDDISRSSDEQLKRFPFFKKRAIRVYNGNKEGRSYRMALNHFADRTDEEAEMMFRGRGIKLSGL